MRLILTLLLIIPMALYYLGLYYCPETLAHLEFMGWPLSIFLGVVVMVWAVLIGGIFAIYYLKRELRDEEEEGGVHS